MMDRKQLEKEISLVLSHLQATPEGSFFLRGVTPYEDIREECLERCRLRGDCQMLEASIHFRDGLDEKHPHSIWSSRKGLLYGFSPEAFGRFYLDLVLADQYPSRELLARDFRVLQARAEQDPQSFFIQRVLDYVSLQEMADLLLLLLNRCCSREELYGRNAAKPRKPEEIPESLILGELTALIFTLGSYRISPERKISLRALALALEKLSRDQEVPTSLQEEFLDLDEIQVHYLLRQLLSQRSSLEGRMSTLAGAEIKLRGMEFMTKLLLDQAVERGHLKAKALTVMVPGEELGEVPGEKAPRVQEKYRVLVPQPGLLPEYSWLRLPRTRAFMPLPQEGPRRYHREDLVNFFLIHHDRGDNPRIQSFQRVFHLHRRPGINDRAPGSNVDYRISLEALAQALNLVQGARQGFSWALQGSRAMLRLPLKEPPQDLERMMLDFCEPVYQEVRFLVKDVPRLIQENKYRFYQARARQLHDLQWALILRGHSDFHCALKSDASGRFSTTFSVLNPQGSALQRSLLEYSRLLPLVPFSVEEQLRDLREFLQENLGELWTQTLQPALAAQLPERMTSENYLELLCSHLSDLSPGKVHKFFGYLGPLSLYHRLSKPGPGENPPSRLVIHWDANGSIFLNVALQMVLRELMALTTVGEGEEALEKPPKLYKFLGQKLLSLLEQPGEMNQRAFLEEALGGEIIHYLQSNKIPHNLRTWKALISLWTRKNSPALSQFLREQANPLEPLVQAFWGPEAGEDREKERKRSQKRMSTFMLLVLSYHFHCQRDAKDRFFLREMIPVMVKDFLMKGFYGSKVFYALLRMKEEISRRLFLLEGYATNQRAQRVHEDLTILSPLLTALIEEFVPVQKAWLRAMKYLHARAEKDSTLANISLVCDYFTTEFGAYAEERKFRELSPGQKGTLLYQILQELGGSQAQAHRRRAFGPTWGQTIDALILRLMCSDQSLPALFISPVHDSFGVHVGGGASVRERHIRAQERVHETRILLAPLLLLSPEELREILDLMRSPREKRNYPHWDPRIEAFPQIRDPRQGLSP